MNVAPNDPEYIHDVFAEVPGAYERINHILTLGLDIVWRRRAARIAAREGGDLWMDMCTGTGELAMYLRRLAPEGTRVRGVDFSEEMMAEARKKPEAQRIEFISADIKALPFPDDSIDLITMSFATRNVNVSRGALIQSFAELHRVLKPGGRFVNLETSQPPWALVRKGMHLYIKLCVKTIGAWMSSSPTGYAYLANTIPRFYPPEVLADILREAGFETVTFQRLMFGVAAMHTSRKKTP